MENLHAYANRHAGQDIIVCGCGPSLLELEHPQRHITIGVNDVGRLFDPTYLVVVNPRQQFSSGRFHHIEQSRAQALFTQLDLGPVRPPVVRFALGSYGGTDIGAGNTLHYTQNSPYVAVCLAARMGARCIGLIGVDLCDDHFFARTGPHPLSARRKEIDAQYGLLAAALRQRGVELLNLGSTSRLACLPRAHLDGAHWILDAGKPQCAAPRPARSSSMKVAIEKHTGGLVAQLLDTLAKSVASLGHTVTRDPRHTAQTPGVLSIVWNGRSHPGHGPTLYCEHGWLPRTHYQISPRGINADSHAAPFAWDGCPLNAQQEIELEAHLAAARLAGLDGHALSPQTGPAVARPGAARPDAARPFLLVPLQIESDTNILRHAPAGLRTMQALVDHVSRCNPPWPVIFKQHPADVRRGNAHLGLRLRRAQDTLWPQQRGNVHQMLRSGACQGILTLNSNVAHDGLLWDIPAIVLGRNIWPRSGAVTPAVMPFLTDIPRDWSDLAASAGTPAAIACRRAYAYYLMRNQWSLDEAADPQRVAGLLAMAQAAQDTAPRAKALRTVTPLRRPEVATINVVAQDKGWLLECWKQALASTPLPGYRVCATSKPLAQADAWIFMRTREAAASPDFSRTVVQLHDLFDDGRYQAGGERAAVAACAGLSLTHPQQRALLAANGIDLARRRWLVQPPGWCGAPSLGSIAPDAMPTVAWIGRPSHQLGRELSHLETFVRAALSLRGQARIVLIGERLETAASALRQAGVDCRAQGLARLPMLRTSDWIRTFDCVAITGAADAGPWPLFDAIHAGVPVVATRVGWAELLLADGLCGQLVDDNADMGAALQQTLARRATLLPLRPQRSERAAPYSLAAWLRANLQLAAELAHAEQRVTA